MWCIRTWIWVSYHVCRAIVNMRLIVKTSVGKKNNWKRNLKIIITNHSQHLRQQSFFILWFYELAIWESFICSLWYQMNSLMHFQSLAGQQGMAGPRWTHSYIWGLSGGSGSPFLHVLFHPEGKEHRLSHHSAAFWKSDNERRPLRLKPRSPMVLLLPCYIGQSESQGQPGSRGGKINPTFSQESQIISGHV